MLTNQKEKLKKRGDSKQCRESEESGIDDNFETRDKISGKSEIKLETQTHMKTKIKDTLKNDQNKQSEIEKNFSYQETQRQDEAKTNENFFDELKSIINVLNSKTKKNTSEILGPKLQLNVLRRMKISLKLLILSQMSE